MGKRFRDPSRRSFLKIAGGGILTLGMDISWQQDSEEPRGEHRESWSSRVHLHTYDPVATISSDAVREAMAATSNLGWLRTGDSVFVKVASNSDLAPPAVTSPAALSGVIQVLLERGAETVYVGDMSGALFVRHLATETMGSTRENMRRNGLLAAAQEAGAQIHCFDEVPFERAYIPGIPAGEHHWGNDLYVAEILDRVDHIVNLPRLGKHVLAGASLGLKNAIGWISDHSRMVLHRDADTFHEKIAEVNAIPQLSEKLRLTLTLVDRALTTNGPDTGYSLELEQPMIVASEDVVSHDQITLLCLLWARQNTPRAALQADPYPAESDGLNWWFVRVTWGSDAANEYQPLPTFENLGAVDARTHVNYAYDLLHGGRPDTIEVSVSGLPPSEDLIALLIADPDLPIVLPETN